MLLSLLAMVKKLVLGKKKRDALTTKFRPALVRGMEKKNPSHSEKCNYYRSPPCRAESGKALRVQRRCQNYASNESHILAAAGFENASKRI